MNFSIRESLATDMSSVLKLINELAVFEKEPNAVIINEQSLIEHGFGNNPSFKIFVAETNNEIIGMALFYPRYSTWKGKTFHLEDLIVTKQKRGLGIGKALYVTFLKYAQKQQVKRVEWVVLDWNKTAIDFYKKSGADVFTDWRTTQMTDIQIEQFLKNE